MKIILQDFIPDFLIKAVYAEAKATIAGERKMLDGRYTVGSTVNIHGGEVWHICARPNKNTVTMYLNKVGGIRFEKGTAT